MLRLQDTGDILGALPYPAVLIDYDVIVFFADDDFLPCPVKPCQDDIIRFRAPSAKAGLQNLPSRGDQHNGNGVGEEPLHLHGAVRFDLQDQIVAERNKNVYGSDVELDGIPLFPDRLN